MIPCYCFCQGYNPTTLGQMTKQASLGTQISLPSNKYPTNSFT
jgi:hypothetical protein